MEIVAAREFNSLYIYLDIAWLIIYAVILLWRKRHIAFIAGLAGGIIYFAVDYGIFYLALKTRVITGATDLPTSPGSGFCLIETIIKSSGACSRL
jgi:hypothetical protein